MTGLVAIVVAGAFASVGTAETCPIDVERSTLTVSVYKSGPFAAFADNHIIRAPIARGHVTDAGTLSVEVAIRAADLMVLDPALPASKRAEVALRMQGR